MTPAHQRARTNRVTLRTAGIVVIAMLAWAKPASTALPVDPENPAPRACIPAVRGSINARPATAEIRPDEVTAHSSLSWSATIVRDCGVVLGFVIENQPVNRIGAMGLTFTTPATYRYTLKMRLTRGNPLTVATTTVQVVSHPPVTLSPGRSVTAEDIQQFDYLWMHPPLITQMLEETGWHTRQWDLSWAWYAGERMRAMVRMYELTHERRYLDHLRDLIEIVLQYRDDRHPDERHLDAFRPTQPAPMPAWGVSSPGNAWHWRTSPVIAAAYSYPMAAFARLVAESPELQGVYGASALSYTNAVLDTFEAYYADWRSRGAGMYMKSPENAQSLLSEEQCDQAYAEAQALGWDSASRLATFHTQCIDADTYAAGPEAHNIDHLFATMAIELFRAIDSPFYEQSPAYRWTGLHRALIPALVTGNQRFFLDSLSTDEGRYSWEYMVDSFRPHIEDTSHAAVSMRYIGLLYDNISRLDAQRPATREPIPLTATHLNRFANTFLQKVAPGEHFAHDVSGRPENPIDGRDTQCDGWLELARARPEVYEKCAAITLRTVGGNTQPYLSVGNHAALLWTKQFR